MLRKVAATIFALFMMFGVSLASGRNEAQKSEDISGEVVAYDDLLSLLPCYHICGGSLLVRVNKSDEKKPRYIRVDFRYPDGKFPKGLVESRKQYRFKLIRTGEVDEPINEFVTAVDDKGQKINVKVPAWKLVSGAENEKLPFGETLPSYSLIGDASELTGVK